MAKNERGYFRKFATYKDVLKKLAEMYGALYNRCFCPMSLFSEEYADLNEWGWRAFRHIRIIQNGTAIIIYDNPEAIFFDDCIDCLHLDDILLKTLLGDGVQKIRELEEAYAEKRLKSYDGIGRTYEAQIIAALERRNREEKEHG